MRRHHGRALSPYAGRVAAPPSAEVTLVRDFDHHLNPSRPARQSPLATSGFSGMPLDLIDRIRSFPLFQQTSDGFLTDLSLMLKPQMYSLNDSILREGEDAKSMYWLVRGAVAVTSLDGESTFAELKSGAFFGEIGILLERPRTASVVARARCLVLVLMKEDLKKLLPRYPDVERTIREEAMERLAQTEKKKRQIHTGIEDPPMPERRGSKRARDPTADDMDMSDSDVSINGASKRRKSPSPGTQIIPTASALGHGLVNIRATLKELPLFANLPAEMLHFLGLNAQPRSYAPFVDIVKQDTMGREVFFIVRGEVEVLDENYEGSPNVRRRSQPTSGIPRTPLVKARLKAGHYFGEVVSLSLADRRTATVRSVTQCECLMISENVLNEFWFRCPKDVKQTIENTARQRLQANTENDVVMDDADAAPKIDDLAIGEQKSKKDRKILAGPKVTFNDTELATQAQATAPDELSVLEPSDPDPFSSAGLDKVRSRSRRGSLAPPSPDDIARDRQRRRGSRVSPTSTQSPSPRSSQSGTPSPISEARTTGFPWADPFPTKRPALKPNLTYGENRGTIPEQLLARVFQYLELHECMRLQRVSQHWQNVLTKSTSLFRVLDLTPYNRKVNDLILINQICPFVGARPEVIDISNCFHITDEGFNALASTCGANAKIWKMKSVWDVTAPAILEMSNKAKNLKAIDLSNCRKASDTLLARIVGWVVPGQKPGTQLQRHSSVNGQRPQLNTKLSGNNTNSPPPPGTVFGCPDLASISLSYCKHISDRTMHHIANHAANRIESVDLTRCTTITDSGFQYWGNVRFEKLRRLCLADCTYLSDQSIVWLVNGAGSGLRELDLVSAGNLTDSISANSCSPSAVRSLTQQPKYLLSDAQI
jgi:F-box and leucine-rich repeat protein 7